MRPRPPKSDFDDFPKPFSLDTTPTRPYDPFMAGSASEKRETVRRKGNAIKVLIRGPSKDDEPVVGYVLDRSGGGMALCTHLEFPNGAVLHVRPDSHFENGVWAKIEVRSVRRDRDDWHLGCKFIESLPWSVLLQFG